MSNIVPLKKKNSITPVYQTSFWIRFVLSFFYTVIIICKKKKTKKQFFRESFYMRFYKFEEKTARYL